MSDCSTAAMVPKESPPTCGSYILFGDGYEMQFDDATQSENWRQGIEGVNWNAVNWIEIDGTKFVPEQRYQQLEQVARETYVMCNTLLEAIENIANEDNAQLRACSAIGAVSAAGHVMSYIDDQLKALGVSVDG